MNPTRKPLLALHGLRFFAAFHVLAFHYAPVTSGTWLGLLVSRGPSSVSLFFVLSGFILAYNYIDPASRPRVSPWPFWWARLARIYPVYLLGLVLGAPAFWHRISGGDVTVAATRCLKVGVPVILLVQAWIPDAACLWNCPGWSLSAEVFFYFIFPSLIAASVIQTRRRIFLSIAGWVLFGAILQALWWVVLRRREAQHEGVAITSWLSVRAYSPLLYAYQFFVGVGVGRLFSRQTSSSPMAPWIGISTLVGILWLLGSAWSADGFLVADFCLTALFAALVWSLASGAGFVARTLSQPPCVVLGEASYSLYLLHGPIHNAVQIVQSRWLMDARPAYVFWCYAAASVAVSVVVFRFFEEPARKWLRGLQGVMRSARDVGRDSVGPPVREPRP